MQINRKARKFMRQYHLKRKGGTIQGVEKAAAFMGYEVGYFNPNDDQQIALLRKLSRNHFDGFKKAVTVTVNGKKAIYISDFSSEQDKTFLLLHELAHIYLNHNYKSGITDTGKEIQANDFASYIIRHGTVKRLLPALIAGTVTVFLAALSAFFMAKSTNPNIEPVTVAYSTASDETSKPPAEQTPLPDLSKEQTVISEPVPIQPSIFPSEQPAPPSPIPIPTEELTPQPTPQQTITVYITRTGQKYHLADCYHISGKSAFSIDINEAKYTGYEACKSCRPD